MCVVSSTLGAGAESGTDQVLQKNADGTRTWVPTADVGAGGAITELTGDVTAGPGAGSQAATIPNDTVTYAKMQNVSAASRLLGRGSASGSGDVQEISLGSGLSMSGTTLSAPGSGQTGAITCSIDGGGAVITTGEKASIRIPVACTIVSVTLLSDDAAVTSGSIVIDIWKDTYANYPPTVADTITASAKPTISSATKSEDTTLTGWTTSVNSGDVLRFKVDSVTSLKHVTMILKVTVP